MSKVRKNYTFTPENAEFLESQDNASALLNRLVDEYRSGGGAETVIIDYRIEELSGEISGLESRLGSKSERLEELKSRRERIRTSIDRDIKPIVNDLEDRPEFITTDNPRIQDVAINHDMPPSVVVERALEMVE